jgi:hypothetical protein
MELDYYDVRLLNAVLHSADEDGMLGTCSDYMDGDECTLCTALERLYALELRLRREETKVLHTDDSV